MICLRDALKMAKDPTAGPCAKCIVDGLRNPLGEALASIASISHARIQTRRRTDDGGQEIEASGETVGTPRPCAAAPVRGSTCSPLARRTWQSCQSLSSKCSARH